MRHLGAVRLILAAGLALGAAGASAQAVTDPGDLAFWQSIQASTDAREYRAYLKTYPQGRFAGLAEVRADQLEKGGAPQPAPANPAVQAARANPTPVPTPPAEEPAPVYVFTVSPLVARIGQLVKVGCPSLPTGKYGDKIVIVSAGTPVMAPNRSAAETGELWSDHTSNCVGSSLEAGPFAPGAYEARWMTSLLNNDKPQRFELKAMVPFTVR